MVIYCFSVERFLCFSLATTPGAAERLLRSHGLGTIWSQAANRCRLRLHHWPTSPNGHREKRDPPSDPVVSKPWSRRWKLTLRYCDAPRVRLSRLANDFPISCSNFALGTEATQPTTVEHSEWVRKSRLMFCLRLCSPQGESGWLLQFWFDGLFWIDFVFRGSHFFSTDLVVYWLSLMFRTQKLLVSIPCASLSSLYLSIFFVPLIHIHTYTSTCSFSPYSTIEPATNWFFSF